MLQVNGSCVAVPVSEAMHVVDTLGQNDQHIPVQHAKYHTDNSDEKIDTDFVFMRQ